MIGPSAQDPNCGNVKQRVKFFWLNFHLPYACRHSGMCCTSGWPIPVEHARVTAIDETHRSAMSSPLERRAVA